MFPCIQHARLKSTLRRSSPKTLTEVQNLIAQWCSALLVTGKVSRIWFLATIKNKCFCSGKKWCLKNRCKNRSRCSNMIFRTIMERRKSRQMEPTSRNKAARWFSEGSLRTLTCSLTISPTRNYRIIIKGRSQCQWALIKQIPPGENLSPISSTPSW